MKLVNLTPHAVTIITSDTVSITIQPSGRVARCRVVSRSLDSLTVGGQSIPVATSELGEVTDLPEEPVDGVAYIVSRIVAEACPERTDLYFPGEVVRDASGAIIACRGLCRISPR